MATGEALEALEFKNLAAGDVLTVTTGVGDEAWDYYFVVDEPGRWPKCRLDVRNPDGDEVGEISFEIHGCGRWTNRQQNPVQDQERAFTPYYDGLRIGSFMWGKFEGAENRSSFDKPGQEISYISHTTANP